MNVWEPNDADCVNPPQPPKQIAASISYLDSALARLDRQLGNLFEEVSPVLRAAKEVKTGDAICEGRDCPLAAVITDAANRIDQLASAVSRARDLLEL